MKKNSVVFFCCFPSSLLLYKIDYDADSTVDTIKSRVKLF
jgi:hypothetical protein